jgi:tRNA(fMet)-specific endonuclease VapC
VTHLFDTDTFNHFHAGQSKVLDRAKTVGIKQVAITVITRIEVLQGRFDFVLKAANIEQMLRAQKRLDETDQALAGWDVLPLDAAACEQFTRLKAVKGLRKIGRADLLMASIALASQATLVPRNVRDFSIVPNLKWENWVD